MRTKEPEDVDVEELIVVPRVREKGRRKEREAHLLCPSELM